MIPSYIYLFRLIIDARSEDLLRQFGKPALIKLRDESKKVACPTYEQYVEEIAAIRLLPPEVRAEVIRGPFDAHPVLKPKERAVHKKLSAEEEVFPYVSPPLYYLHPSPNYYDGPCVADDDAPPGVLTDAPPPVIHAEDGAGLAGRSGRRVSLSQTDVTLSKTPRAVQASPAVLSFLQNDFCNKQRKPSGSPEKPSNHLSPPKMAVILDGDEMQDEGGQVPVDAMPKSHALMKLMGLATKSVPVKRPSMLHDPNLLEDLSKPNMMAEIQRRRSSKGTPPPSPLQKKQGVNFLDELKRRAEARDSSAAQAKNPIEEGHDVAKGEETKEVAPAKPMSFLDELKKKAKAKE
ncbi:hypothetical protein DYB38_005992 [Aphanomyces astaci]|uniref:Uncharacterized protein n=1 Tax=Aphanomyces astaci TaxID=112090 RepID=A0A397EKE4_APHAT|nr:hypothetical protein DYB38_005992 [Aphanomyces astaci]RHY81030.1 hypothetical protein DYB31_008362 [Aphanomyces astaci]